jgi:hypothetical protein
LLLIILIDARIVKRYDLILQVILLILALQELMLLSKNHRREVKGCYVLHKD